MRADGERRKSIRMSEKYEGVEQEGGTKARGDGARGRGIKGEVRGEGD